jgi:hypothetical protein
MSAANLKIDLINKITQLRDTGIIKEIKKVLDFELDEGVFKTSETQRRRILAGKSEMKNKKTISEATANKAIEEWLRK